MGHIVTGWPDEAVASLRKHWEDGLSASQIAAELAREHRFRVSRNGVIGKVYRLGLPGRKRGCKPKVPRERKWEIRPRRRREQVREIELPAEPFVDLPPDTSPDACTLVDMRETSCRYPMGEVGTEAFRFCGSERLHGHSYCVRHCRVVYNPHPLRPVSTWNAR